MSKANESQINFYNMWWERCCFFRLCICWLFKGGVAHFLCPMSMWADDVKSSPLEVNSLPLLLACVCRLQFVISDIWQNVCFWKVPDTTLFAAAGYVWEKNRNHVVRLHPVAGFCWNLNVFLKILSCYLVIFVDRIIKTDIYMNQRSIPQNKKCFGM